MFAGVGSGDEVGWGFACDDVQDGVLFGIDFAWRGVGEASAPGNITAALFDDTAMIFDPRIHHRRSLRLPGYDYTQAGAYFVTICTRQRECLFGEVVAGEMRLSILGKVASEQWMQLAMRFPGIDCEPYVIMPNHVHGIIILSGDRRVLYANGRGAGEGSHTDDSQVPPLRPYAGSNVVPGSLGAIVRAFKASVTWRIHAMHEYDETPIWQRNYYEHIIRDEADVRRIEDYIQTNPQRWEQDKFHV